MNEPAREDPGLQGGVDVETERRRGSASRSARRRKWSTGLIKEFYTQTCCATKSTSIVRLRLLFANSIDGICELAVANVPKDRRALIPLVTPLATGDRRRDMSSSPYLRKTQDDNILERFLLFIPYPFLKSYNILILMSWV
jgi:hypothetical protein